VGCTTGSREVPGERKPVIRDIDDDEIAPFAVDTRFKSSYTSCNSSAKWADHEEHSAVVEVT
jgi:hypothetical protein